MNEDEIKRDAAIKKTEMFSSLADLAQIGIFVTDPDGNYQYVNAFWLNLTGFEMKEALGPGWIEAVHPDDRVAVLDSWNKAIREGGEFRAEYRFRAKNGKETWVYSIADAQRGPDGKVLRYGGINIDISERKDIEEKLAATNKLLVETQSVAGLGSYVMDIATGKWSASEPLNRVFGVDENHVHSTDEWVAILHPDNREEMVNYFKNEVLGKVGTFNKEYRIVRPIDKQERWVHGLGRLELDSDGRPAKMYGTIQDITDRHAAEETIRSKEKLYHSLFENMLNGFAYCKMVFNEKNEPQDFQYLEVNPAFERQTGLKNVKGKMVSEVIPGIKESDPELLARYGRVALSQAPESFEIYLKSLGMWFSISVYSPEKGYFVVVFDEITRKKKDEEMVKKEVEEQEKINKLMVGRELEMIELKNRITELEDQLLKK